MPLKLFSCFFILAFSRWQQFTLTLVAKQINYLSVFIFLNAFIQKGYRLSLLLP